jgi:RNA polymerase sigma-70 factor (ECF subfamily)
MFGVCLRYADDRDAAEDILQEGFIKVFRKIESYTGIGSLEGWVRKVMVNTALEAYRRKSRMVPLVEVERLPHESEDADALSQLSEAEILKVVQALPHGYRTVFNLYVIDGYSHREIAAELSITEGTSKSQLARARDLLKHQLDKQMGARYGNAEGI